MKNIKFQYYNKGVADEHSSSPLGWVTLGRFIEKTKNPPQHIKDVIAQIHQAAVEGKKQLKSELKKNYLYPVTPCVHIRERRRYDNIISFTGLVVLDFDKLPGDHYTTEFKQFLFDEFKPIIACWLSPSKLGVKALIRIPVVKTVDEYKAYFYGIGVEMEQFNGWDGANQNPVLPLFQSYDPDMLIRENPDTWIKRGMKQNSFNYQKTTVPVQIKRVVANDHNKERILKMIHSGLDKIIDNGHPQLRGLCIAIGGYVTSGYISEHEALQEINSLIEVHPYLRKDVKNYQKTARWGISEGMRKPLTL